MIPSDIYKKPQTFEQTTPAAPQTSSSHALAVLPEAGTAGVAAARPRRRDELFEEVCREDLSGDDRKRLRENYRNGPY